MRFKCQIKKKWYSLDKYSHEGNEIENVWFPADN